jgi:hypothetical protein
MPDLKVLYIVVGKPWKRFLQAREDARDPFPPFDNKRRNAINFVSIPLSGG